MSPSHLPPPPGFDEQPPRSPAKIIAIIAGVVLLAAGVAAAVRFRGRAASPAPATESPVVGAPVSSPVPDYGVDDTAFPGLPGVFYDLQKTASGLNSSLPHGQAAGPAFVAAFLKGEMTADAMKDGFRAAPTTLRTARFAFSARPPKEIRELFGHKDGKGPVSIWTIVYRGRVKAPFTGEFRFVGFGSDDLAVRFAGGPALDAWHARVKAGSDLPFEEVFRFGIPKKDGTYVGDPVRAGPWIAVEKGAVYDIAVAMTHMQAYSGAKFFLMYERKGDSHPAGTGGYPTYTRFRVAEDPGPPTPEDPEGLPPAGNGPVFPVVP